MLYLVWLTSAKIRRVSIVDREDSDELAKANQVPSADPPPTRMTQALSEQRSKN